MDGGKEFGFGGASRHCGLDFGLVRQGAPAENEDKTGDQATRDKVGSMCSVDVSSKFS